MKQLKLTYLFAFALLLGGCKDDVDLAAGDVEQSSDLAISFGGMIDSDSATKGAVIEDEASLATMGVYSYKTNSGVVWGSQSSGDDVLSFFNDFNDAYPITVSYVEDNGAWDYGYTRYWPSDGSLLHFYAWAPAERINRTFNYTSGLPEFNHTLSSNAVDNLDLMWSPAQVDQVYTEANQGKVTFDFTHALSRISLYARIMVTSVSDKETDPTNKYSYERFGINGITFYDVINKATVAYDANWEPSWVLDPDSRTSITASQGNTLLQHYNSIRTDVGQVPKIAENSEEINSLSTYNNVMLVTDDDDGTKDSYDTYGIFMHPQTFSGDEADSPGATMRVRIRHYDNEFISIEAAKDSLSTYGESYYDHIYCNDEGKIAVIYFDPLADITNVDNQDANSQLLFYSEEDFNNLFYPGGSAATSVTINEDGNDDAEIGTVDVANLKCVGKDQVGDIYTTSDISLSSVFTDQTNFPNGGLSSGQHVALYFTFDLRDGAEIEVPMTVYAEVYDWIDVDVDSEVYDQLVVYSNEQEITEGSGSMDLYTKCLENIEITSISAENATVALTTPTSVSGSDSAVKHTFSYTGATEGSDVTVTITIYKVASKQYVTKQFTYTVVTNSEN